ncbi:hypothetical protein BJY00DRAFT_311679 [Aspergillus carlsbadensis]|nr:hypothetical protein BJY00DRAFT_311679 [Aspergillus carlsbadensis]
MSTEKASTSTPTVVRRSKTMPIDSPTAKFLYTILKQLDLKGIDWSLVASQLEISNGHAARMRYHRFKNQMEGTTSTPRKRTANKTSKIAGSSKGCFQKEISPQPLQMIKTERQSSPCEMKPYVKTETDQYPQHVPNLVDIPQHVTSPRAIPMSMPMSMQGAPRACGPPLPAPMSYQRMDLVPELAMYGLSSTPMPMPMHASMAMGYAQGRCSPVAWTPVKVDEEDNVFAKQEMDVDTVKGEIVHEPVKLVE